MFLHFLFVEVHEMLVKFVVIPAEIDPAEAGDADKEDKQAKDDKEGDVGANEPREHKAHEYT
jgi:hypothetical protein